MTKLFLYVHDLRSSGVVRNALAYAHRLARDRETVLVAGYGQGLFAEEARDGGFALVELARAPGPLPRLLAAVRLRRWLGRQEAGVLFSVGNLGHPSCFWATRGLGHVRRIYRISNTIARDDGVRSRLRRLWMGRLVRDAAQVILVGHAHRETPLFARALAAGRTVEIANGVDRAAARARAAAPLPHPWLGEAVPTVLAVGRLRPQKNLDVLIAAVAQARATCRLRLILLGGGTAAERARLTALADEAGLGADFLLAGETDNVFAWLGRATVFALPSRWEGSSMALLEAIAVGTPVVAARTAGDAARVLDGGRYGLLVDGNDPAALATALLRQASDAPVQPGDRADAYGLSVDAYAALVGAVCDRAG